MAWWDFKWFGDRVRAQWEKEIDRRMHRAGEAIVNRAKQLAPVRTGALRDSIDYIVLYNPGQRSELRVTVGMPYGIFQEFGTRNIPPHPYIRPAMNEFGRIWGFDIAMDFQAPTAPGQWAGLLAGIGPGGAGFAAAAHPAWKPLTPKQLYHVQHVLTPSIKRLNVGNARRARLNVRRVIP